MVQVTKIDRENKWPTNMNDLKVWGWFDNYQNYIHNYTYRNRKN